jgi:hypothetical protein
VSRSARMIIPCPWCQCDESHPVTSGEDRYSGETDFQVVRCRCRLLYTRERPVEDALSRFYPEEFYDALSKAPAPRRVGVANARQSAVLHAVFGYPTAASGRIERLDCTCRRGGHGP